MEKERALCLCGHHRRVHLFGWQEKRGSCLHLDSSTGQYCLCSSFRVEAGKLPGEADGTARKPPFTNVADGMKCK